MVREGKTGGLGGELAQISKKKKPQIEMDGAGVPAGRPLPLWSRSSLDVRSHQEGLIFSRAKELRKEQDK